MLACLAVPALSGSAVVRVNLFWTQKAGSQNSRSDHSLPRPESSAPNKQHQPDQLQHTPTAEARQLPDNSTVLWPAAAAGNIACGALAGKC